MDKTSGCPCGPSHVVRPGVPTPEACRIRSPGTTAVLLDPDAKALETLRRLPGYRCFGAVPHVTVDVSEAPTREAFMSRYEDARQLGWSANQAAHAGAVGALVAHRRKAGDYTKTCACGRSYDLRAFFELPRLAGGESETEGNLGGRAFWRDCLCGSTIAVEVLPDGRPVTDAEQLAALEIAEPPCPRCHGMPGPRGCSRCGGSGFVPAASLADESTNPSNGWRAP